MLGWKRILDFQYDFYPDWQKKPRLLFSTALAGEAGEVCGVVTHLDGGGTNNKKYTEQMVLHECVDTYIQLVLLIARSGFSWQEFHDEFDKTMNELQGRLVEKRSIECAGGRT